MLRRAAQLVPWPFLVALAGVLVAGRSKLLRDPGTYWHPVVGRDLLATGRAPAADRFTFTARGEPWVAHQWLAEGAMAILDRVGGLDALLVAAAVLIAATFATLHQRLRGEGVSAPAALSVLALAAAAATPHLHARPHLLSLALLPALLAWLDDVDRGRRGPAALLLVPPLLCLWANLHAGALVGLLLVLVALAGLAWPTAHRPPPVQKAHAAALALLALAAPLANPYGVRLLETWWALLRSPVLPTLIVEHAPPTPGNPELWLHLALVVVYVAALVTAPPERRRLGALLPLLLAAAGFLRVRHMALFAVTAPVGLAALLPGARWLSPAAPAPRRRLWPVAAGVLAVALLLQGLGVRGPLFGRGWARPPETEVPVSLLPALSRALAAAGDDRVFNDLGLGGFLIHFAPQARIFIDDRCELHGDARLRAYRNLLEDPRAVGTLLAAHRLSVALVRPGSALSEGLALTPRFRRVAAAPGGELWVREPDPGAAPNGGPRR